jgi:hypothetical protein
MADGPRDLPQKARRRGDRAHKSSRRADRWIGLLIVVLAAVAGVLAGRSGTPKSWEHPAPGTPGGSKVVSAQVQGSP